MQNPYLPFFFFLLKALSCHVATRNLAGALMGMVLEGVGAVDAAAATEQLPALLELLASGDAVGKKF